MSAALQACSDSLVWPVNTMAEPSTLQPIVIRLAVQLSPHGPGVDIHVKAKTLVSELAPTDHGDAADAKNGNTCHTGHLSVSVSHALRASVLAGADRVGVVPRTSDSGKHGSKETKHTPDSRNATCDEESRKCAPELRIAVRTHIADCL